MSTPMNAVLFTMMLTTGHVPDVQLLSWVHHFVSCMELPISTWAWIGFHFATHCNVDQRTRNAATRCILQEYKANLRSKVKVKVITH